MNAIFVKHWLWHNEENFETESLLSQSLDFKRENVYHRHVHTCSFTTVQKQNLPY